MNTQLSHFQDHEQFSLISTDYKNTSLKDLSKKCFNLI